MLASQYAWTGLFVVGCLLGVAVWLRGRTVRLLRDGLVTVEVDLSGDGTGGTRLGGVFAACVAVSATLAVTVTSVVAAAVELGGQNLLDTTDPTTLAALVPLPGISPYLPVWAVPYLSVAVACGVVVHEYGHLRQFHRYGVETVSAGVVLLPTGAFVRRERDDSLSRGQSLVTTAAGIGANVAVAVVAAVALVAFVTAVAGAGVPAGGNASTTVEEGPGSTTDSVTTPAGERQLLRLLSVDGPPSVFHTPARLVSLLAPSDGADPVVGLTTAPSTLDTSLLPASLATAVTNLLLWIVFVNTTLAVVNAAPVYPLDGTTVTKLVVASTVDSLPGGVTRRRLLAALLGVTVAFLGSLLVVFAPIELLG
jgi:Zn-dependent protease